MYHSTLGWRVIKKKKRKKVRARFRAKREPLKDFDVKATAKLWA